MKVLFLTLTYSTREHISFYEDLLQQFVKHGQQVYVACARERSSKEINGLEIINNISVLRVKTGNIVGNVSIIEKGLSTLLIDYQFKSAILKYYGDIKFDLILYPTPPITFVNTISTLKKRTGAFTYLLLKDIFPQNAVDLGMMPNKGIKAFIYNHFRCQEQKLYSVSDRIGCMSPANVRYVVNHNRSVDASKVELCPNCIDIPSEKPKFKKDSKAIREKYNIPDDAVIFLYGGNFGKPQGINFLVKALKRVKDNNKAFFIMIGSGAQRSLLDKYVIEDKPSNVIVLDYLPKDEYQQIADNCDVGLIFLDHRFTIPNFPSRLLSYLTGGIPVLSATDPNSDIGVIAQDNGFGYSCESNDVEAFARIVNDMINSDRERMGENAWKFFLNNYTTEIGYNIIIKHLSR